MATRGRVGGEDLFDPQAGDWLEDPGLAFDTWLAARKGRGIAAQAGLKASSAVVYRAQWGAFLRYLQHARVRRLEDASEGHVSAFLAGLQYENRHQRARIRALIEGVLRDILRTRAAPGTPNPAVLSLLSPSYAWKEVRGNRPMSFLSAQECQVLTDYLLSPLMLPGLGARWREARDRALLGVYLGAGLKVVESLSLTINCVTDDYQWLNLYRAPSQFSHRTQLLAFAQTLLAQWLALRAHAGTLGDRVFPAAPNGRPMHAVTALRAANAIVIQCGLAHTRQERTSPQTLRNTYGAQLLARGETDLALCASLGFSELVTAARMRAAWHAWQAGRAGAPPAHT